MASANMQLIMSDVGAGHEIRNHRHAIAARCARCSLDLLAIHQSDGVAESVGATSGTPDTSTVSFVPARVS